MAGKRHPIRFYDVHGKRLPSVTSILGRTDPIFEPSKESGLQWWRDKEPNHRQIVDDACLRGSIIHAEIELALTGKQSLEYDIGDWVKFGIPDYMTNLLEVVQTMGSGEVHCEKVVTHPAGYAGTTDLICEFEGEMTVVDFKTTRHHSDVGEKEKKRSHYKSAELQVAAYGAAWNSDCRRPKVTQGLIVVAYSWREPQLIRLDRDDLTARVGQFAERLSTFKALEG
jgi:genome maintenance exonuclease 1